MAPPRKHQTDQILDAARAIVLRHGPRAASVAAIARDSGAPVGTLYHRFGSRDGVLAAVWLRALGRFQEGALAAAAPHDDPLDRAEALAAAAIEFAGRHRDDARLLLAVRREDLLDRAPDGAFRRRLNELNAPLVGELQEIARALYGRADARAVAAVSRAVVDLPYSAVRTYSGRPEFPAWLAGDVAADARRLLEARRDEAVNRGGG
ncbi:MAG TPA: helix-turn-helix domain-containing protein [Solirubrobacteraceae bacterium]